MIIETASGAVKEITEAHIERWENYYCRHIGYMIISDEKCVAKFYTMDEAEKEMTRFKKWLNKGAKGIFKFTSTFDRSKK